MSKRTLCPTTTAPPMNSRSAGQHLVDRGRRQHHGLGDAGEHGDLGWDGQTRVDQGLEGAEALAAVQLHRPDLGDRAVGRRTPGGLEVDHDEGDVVQRGAEVIEGPLPEGRSSHLPLVDEHVFERKDRSSRRYHPSGGWATSLSLYGMRESHAVRRDHDASHAGVSPLHGGWRSRDRGRTGALRGGRVRGVPLVRVERRTSSRSRPRNRPPDPSGCWIGRPERPTDHGCHTVFVGFGHGRAAANRL